MFAKKQTAALIAAALLGAAAQAAPAQWAATHTLAHVPMQKGVAAHDAGVMAASQTVHISVVLKVRNKAWLDQLTQGLMRGTVKRHISSAEFMSRYAPTVAQARDVALHLRQSGFSNIRVSPNRMVITADGNATSAQAAFQTRLHRFSVNGRAAYANVDAARVPPQLAGTVLAVHGLQNVSQFHTMMKLARHIKTADFNTNAVAGHNPTDFEQIYNAAGLPTASNTTVGIIAEGDMTQTLADLSTFASNAGYAQPATKVINAGTPTSDTSGTGEWNLDSQDILAAAGGAVQQMNFYVAPSMSNPDITAAVNAAVSDGTAKVINISLGECEDGAQSSGMTASLDQIFQTGVAQGQIFSVSTGDSGSDECRDGSQHQSYPAVSPYVVAVGGTTVTTNGNTSYVSESTWNNGGGGQSSTEQAPSWQSGVLNGDTRRGTPDISFDADPASGALVLVNGQQQQIGGTSLAAPLFTGFWARIESSMNNSVNSPNASFYQYFGNNANLYNDIADGSSNGAWTAQAGWDYATGWGSLNVANLQSFIKSTPGF